MQKLRRIRNVQNPAPPRGLGGFNWYQSVFEVAGGESCIPANVAYYHSSVVVTNAQKPQFRDGKEGVEDDPRTGRPSTSITPDNIERVHQMIFVVGTTRGIPPAPQNKKPTLRSSWCFASVADVIMELYIVPVYASPMHIYEKVPGWIGLIDARRSGIITYFSHLVPPTPAQLTPVLRSKTPKTVSPMEIKIVIPGDSIYMITQKRQKWSNTLITSYVCIEVKTVSSDKHTQDSEESSSLPICEVIEPKLDGASPHTHLSCRSRKRRSLRRSATLFPVPGTTASEAGSNLQPADSQEAMTPTTRTSQRELPVSENACRGNASIYGNYSIYGFSKTVAISKKIAVVHLEYCTLVEVLPEVDNITFFLLPLLGECISFLEINFALISACNASKKKSRRKKMQHLYLMHFRCTSGSRFYKSDDSTWRKANFMFPVKRYYELDESYGDTVFEMK
ncbi:hypothetical protein C0J52_09432 [Blattella germanica]|nr:hypothetical protein C0J52_09432 [Blattella germanica]